MPAYFSLTLQFDKNKIADNLSQRVCSAVINGGFPFISGYWFHEEETLDEITSKNQELLNEELTLGLSQHAKHDYAQLLFDSEYSEMRGFWSFSGENVDFTIIIPQEDLIFYNSTAFINHRILPIKALALSLWESGLPNAIQTSLEGEMCFPLDALRQGAGVCYDPFAIVSREDFKRLDKRFDEDTVAQIGGNGVFIEEGKTLKITKTIKRRRRWFFRRSRL